jgi:hypothetical protein
LLAAVGCCIYFFNVVPFFETKSLNQ